MKQKILMTVLTLAIAGYLVSGTTGAYFTANADVNQAAFTTGKVDIEFNGNTTVDDVSRFANQKQVSWTIENIGNNKVFLRVKPIIPDLSIYGTNGSIALAPGINGWTEEADGYFYYSDEVALAGKIDFSLIISFDQIWSTVEGLPIDIQVEAIQTANNAKNQLWLATSPT